MVSDGTIAGIDVTALISGLGEGNFNLRQGPDAKTAFSDLGGSFTISDGIAETQNLKMVSPLLKVTAEGTVDLARSNLDILAHPEIIAGPEGKSGANDLAGLTVPVRIEGPLEDPRIKPQIGGVFANPESASKTVNKIGEALQKKFKGKPVGEAIGRFLGNVQIGGGGSRRRSVRRKPWRRRKRPSPIRATPTRRWTLSWKKSCADAVPALLACLMLVERGHAFAKSRNAVTVCTALPLSA